MLPALLTIAGVHLIALASPGPDVFIVMQTAASRSRREAFCCVLGISLGVAFWVTLALLRTSVAVRHIHLAPQNCYGVGRHVPTLDVIQYPPTRA